MEILKYVIVFVFRLDYPQFIKACLPRHPENV